MINDDIKYKLSEKIVGIAGCGGLGSNCAVALVRVGIGKLIIADFDIVSESNLNRQYYFYDQIGMKKVIALSDNLIRINPEAEVELHDIKLTSSDIVEIFSECDVIVEAFDVAEMKEMLIETAQSEWPDKPVISGLGLAGWGNNNSITTVSYGNIHICGDMISEVSGSLPPLAPRVGVVANMQANKVLEILLK